MWPYRVCLRIFGCEKPPDISLAQRIEYAYCWGNKKEWRINCESNSITINSMSFRFMSKITVVCNVSMMHNCTRILTHTQPCDHWAPFKQQIDHNIIVITIILWTDSIKLMQCMLQFIIKSFISTKSTLSLSPSQALFWLWLGCKSYIKEPNKV